MRLVSWNVNGIRAIAKKLDHRCLKDLFDHFQADIVCFQETKVSGYGDLTKEIALVDGYDSFWSFARTKKGYSGVATFVRKGLTLDVQESFGDPQFDDEGRILMSDHGNFILFNIYFPNAGMGDHRLDYKMRFYQSFLEHCNDLIVNRGRSVIICGDINTAHKDIDVWNPKKFCTSTGFLPEERAWLDSMIGDTVGHFLDSFRYFHPYQANAFSFWDSLHNCRSRNEGWRIDYFLVDKKFHQSNVVDAAILTTIRGSDHCPVSLVLQNQSQSQLSLRDSAKSKLAAVQPHFCPKNQPNILSYFKSNTKKVASASDGSHVGIRTSNDGTSSTQNEIESSNRQDESFDIPKRIRLDNSVVNNNNVTVKK